MRNADQQFFWEQDCKKWRGHVLNGPDAHWCFDWDELPIDALTPEYEVCVCYPKSRWGKLVNKIYMFFFYRREEWVRFRHPEK